MLDAGMPCTDEGRFSCLPGHGVVCCFGQSQEFFDGPCGPSPRLDGAVASCGDSPMEGCPCALDAGTSTCDGSQRWECVTGAWHATSHACGSLCSSGP
jgi:hypothetical protein